MAKTLNKWLDEFVENGANPSDVTGWPENAGGGGGLTPVNKLPEKGDIGKFYLLPNGDIYTFMHQEKVVPVYKQIKAGETFNFIYKPEDIDNAYGTLYDIQRWITKAGSVTIDNVPTISSGNQLVGYDNDSSNPFQIVIASNSGEEIGRAIYNNGQMEIIEGDLTIPLSITLTQEIINEFTQPSGIGLYTLAGLLEPEKIGYETVVTEWWQKTNGAIVIDVPESGNEKYIYLDDPEYDAMSIINSVLNGGDVRLRRIYKEGEFTSVVGIRILNEIQTVFNEESPDPIGLKLLFEGYTVDVFLKNEPERVEFEIGDNIDVPGQGQVQYEVLSCNKTFDEIIEMYNADPNNTQIKCIIVRDGREEISTINTAQKDGDSYYFDFFPKGHLGGVGLDWDNTNQKFVYWNGVM